jgi:predicted enzyme related to lactoylglutathione lyase
MSVRDTPWPDGTPNWVDLTVRDMGAARLFYEGLFGWDIVAGPEQFGGYSNCSKEGKLVAGLAPAMSPEQTPGWTTYFATSDAASTVAKVGPAGGHVVAEPMAVAELGTMAIVLDPGGAAFGLWQAGAHTGSERVNEPGAPYWNEHLTTDWERDKDFYAAVFGWTYADMSQGEFKYATFKAADGREVGGIGAVAAGDPPPPAAWLVYFGVDDADEAVDQVVKLGGSLLRPASDSPYGRMAVVADDQGAAFAVIAVTQQV